MKISAIYMYTIMYSAHVLEYVSSYLGCGCGLVQRVWLWASGCGLVQSLTVGSARKLVSTAP